MQSKRRPFGFPKWRSNDAMSASLVASGKVSSLIPKDSNIPEHRKQKIEDTEIKAEYEKQYIHQNIIPKRPLHKGKSLESLTMQIDYKPWYDRERIRGSVSRESIANLGAAKEKFEKEDYIDRTEPIHRQFGTEFNQRPMTPHSQQTSRPPTSMGKPIIAQGILKTSDNSPPMAPLHQSQPYVVPQSYNNYSQQQQQQYHQPIQQQQHQQHLYPQTNPQIVHQQQFHQPPQNQQIPQQQQQPSRQQAVNLSADHYMLLQYIKQNPTVFNDFGIEIPKKLYNLVDDLAFPEHNNHIVVGRQQQPQQPQQPPHQTPVQPVQPTPQNRGRYLKNGMQNNVNPRFRRTYDMSQKQIPENRRQSMQELDHSKAGDNLIAAEIRANKEREDELRRSRSELGLPNLEDTLELWKLGYHSRHPSKNLREAASYDHLNQFHASTDDLNPYDEMIYGPAMRRNTDSTVKVIESPAFERTPNGLRNIRYE
uniref:Uncharacterized protein n=1 Tax=Panagrolaimus sp. ES5 TaxID=591445 RepID=A0AC34FLC8_9BILA